MMEKLKDYVHAIPFRLKVTLLVLAGVFVGLGALFMYLLRAHTYFVGDNPGACVNCHIMAPYYATWSHSSHNGRATCNDCHVPHQSLTLKYGFKAIDGLQIAAILLQGVRIAVPAAALCFVPADVVTNALNSMPAWLTEGMAIGGGMVAAVGYAMVINMMATKEVWPFFVLGFVLAALKELTLIALGALGVALALIYLGLKELAKQCGGAAGSGDPLGDILNDYE